MRETLVENSPRQHRYHWHCWAEPGTTAAHVLRACVLLCLGCGCLNLLDLKERHCATSLQIVSQIRANQERTHHVKKTRCRLNSENDTRPESRRFKKSLLCLLSRRILWIFFSCLPGNFALKNGGDFWWIFSGLRLPRNEARKLLKKFGENSEQNSGQNSGRKFEKFGKFSFCKLPDLRSLQRSVTDHPSLSDCTEIQQNKCFGAFVPLQRGATQLW